MTTETCVLLLTILLGLIYLAVPATMRTLKVGLIPLAGSRDGLGYPDSVHYQRADRANQNFKETAAWALALLIIVQVAGVTNETTAMGAWLYFWSRAAYLPLYVFGVPWLRTIAWAVSLVGMVMLAWPLMG